MSPLYQVYMLHFDAPVGRAQHYVGICKAARLHWRMLEHRRGTGARITNEARLAGIGFSVARTWFCDDPAKEREIKVAGKFAKLCPICSADSVKADPAIAHMHYDPLEPQLFEPPLSFGVQPSQSRYRK